MITGKQNIQQWFEATDCSYWALFNHKGTDSGNWVTRSSQEDGSTPQTALRDLAKALSLISYGKYTLAAIQKAGTLPSKGKFVTDVEISYTDTNAPQQQTQAIAGPSAINVEEAIQKALQDYKLNEEVKQLKAKNAELEKENKELQREDPIGKLVSICGPYIPKILGLEAAQVAGIHPGTMQAAPNTIQHNEVEDEYSLTEQENQRLATVVETFMQADVNWLETLEKMAAKVKADPGILKTLKMFL
jgi:hypothetical protein